MNNKPGALEPGGEGGAEDAPHQPMMSPSNNNNKKKNNSK